MKNSRRMKRMSRNRQMVTRMNLTSLMDVFTILVFFLLVNSSSTEVLETPKQITLPASVVEDKPQAAPAGHVRSLTSIGSICMSGV